MNKYIKLAVMTTAVLMTGCSMLPKYKFDANETTANVKLLGWGSASMCVNGTQYDLPIHKDQDGHSYVTVPADVKVSLFRHIYVDQYSYYYTCNSGLSFQPQAGAKYVNGSEVAHSSCFVELVQVDDGTSTGVKLEPTVGDVSC